MKKILFRSMCTVLVMFMLVPSIVACNKNEKEDESTQSDVVESVSDSETATETEKSTEGDTEAGSETESDTEEDTVIDTETESETESEESDEDYIPKPYMENFGGYKCTVLTQGGYFDSDDFTGELTGSVLSQATYKRNAALKTKYNFEFVETKNVNCVSEAQKLGASGQHAYDIWGFRLNNVPSLAQEGYVYDLNQVDGLNLDAPYYDQAARIQGSFANRLFYLTGDMLYMEDLTTYCLYFDSNEWEKLHLSDKYGKDLYTLVRDGEWTFEKYEEFCKAATYESDGVGGIDRNDHVGNGYSRVDVLVHNIAMGNDLLMKDEEDVFVLNDSAKQINDLTRICQLFATQSFVEAQDDGTVFETGHALFLTWHLIAAEDLQSKGVDFGIVPHPMADEEQEEYRTLVFTYGANCITIASTVSDVDKVANIIELTSYESTTTLKPALHQYLFGGRVLDRVDDVEMMELIMKNKRYELSYLWKTGSLYDTVVELASRGGEEIGSAFESSRTLVEESVERKLQRLSLLP